jgi:hypothetical protein
MGDGYCRHCDDTEQSIPVERDFLLTLLCHLDRDMLSHLQEFLDEEIHGSCDYCRGEVSRQLLALVLKAHVVTPPHRPRIIISIP